ncbi:hypothetical protein CR513_30167, partial [Mucuna pruriens]
MQSPRSWQNDSYDVDDGEFQVLEKGSCRSLKEVTALIYLWIKELERIFGAMKYTKAQKHAPNEESKCMKFQNVLRHEIKNVVGH